MTKTGRPLKMSDEDLVEVIRDAVEAGETDLLEGGVPAAVITERADVHEDTAKKHLQRLVEAGSVVKVRGADPVSYRPRDSYLPADYETSTVHS